MIRLRALPLVLGALLGTGLGCVYALIVRGGDYYEIGDTLLVMGFIGACIGAIIGLVTRMVLTSMVRRR